MCAPVACVAVTWLVRCPPSLRRLELRDWVPPCVAGDAFFGCGEMDTPLEIKPAWPIWLSGFCYHGEIVRAGLRKKVPLYKETFRHAKPRKAIRKPRKPEIAKVRIASSRGHDPRQEILCRRDAGCSSSGEVRCLAPKPGVFRRRLRGGIIPFWGIGGVAPGVAFGIHARSGIRFFACI